MQNKTLISPSQLLLLEKLPGIGPAAIEAVITYLNIKRVKFPESDGGVLNLLKEVKKTYGRLNLPNQQSVQDARAASEQIVADSDKNGITIISRFDDTYPDTLKRIPESPLLLHYKGNLKALDHPTVAIIGTRDCSSFALKQGKEVADAFVAAGFTVISGLAIGCDTIGHKAAVEQGKPTVAVLGCGLDKISPAKNKLLADDILKKGGLLLSEQAYGTNIIKHNLKIRNRIITGLSKAVVVLQTGETGGTMHAVNYAVEQKKRLACLFTSSNEASYMEGNNVLVKKMNAVKLDSTVAVEKFIHELSTSPSI